MKKLIPILFGSIASALTPCYAETLIALTSGNRLLFFDAVTPGTITKTITVSTSANEPLVGIDFRPATGQLYAIAASGRLYIFNLTTGAGTIPAGTPAPLNGTGFGFDFNPVIDRIRLTSDADQNLRLNPDSGSLTATDSNLAYAAADVHAGADPNIVGSAYTNNFPGAATTILYGIDSNLDILVYQDPANGGMLHTVGPLAVNTNGNVGFDISGTTGLAYASLTAGGTAGLYVVNLASGVAGFLGPIADAATLGTETVMGLAAPTPTRLLNISTRGRVDAGENVLIGGFIARGAVSLRVVLRGIGPSLASAGVASPLADPLLQLFDSNGTLLVTNDNWRSSQEAEITATGLAPTNDLESAILRTLDPGAYTTVLSSKDPNNGGVALVEIYQLP